MHSIWKITPGGYELLPLNPQDGALPKPIGIDIQWMTRLADDIAQLIDWLASLSEVLTIRRA
jgi:hypothetical protein